MCQEGIGYEWIGTLYHGVGSLILRWLHVITAIAWIGSSFFFMHLDASLRSGPGMAPGESSAWQVHGGGFYEMRKFMVAPPHLPEELTWHKWQSYWTWISGFFLMVWVYYAQSQLYLIDPAVMALSPFAAGAIGLCALAGGWVVYDLLCKSPLGKHDVALALVGFGYVILASFLFSKVYSGRGALVHTGALMATIMTANVFFIIIPNQKKVVAALKAGEVPDAKYGKMGKQRSMHNNYITLPVLFLMLSNHYPLTYATNALIPVVVALVIVAGALIRHFYNVLHTGKDAPWWTWFVAAFALFLVAWITARSAPGAGMSAAPAPVVTAQVPDDVANIVMSRCSMCHAAEPVWSGIVTAPKGVVLDNVGDIHRQKEAIRLFSVMTHAMPPNNITEMTVDERRELAKWLKG